MKKFYAIVAAAMAAVSMNAQIYVCGEGDGLDWTPRTPKVIEPNADGSYTFELKNLSQFKLSTTQGDWNAFNSGCRWIVMDEGSLGTEQPVYTSDGGGNMYAPWKGDYKFNLQLNAEAGENNVIGKCTVTTTTPKPVGEIQEIYIRGDVNGWGSPDEWKFQSTDGVNYTFVCKDATKIPANKSFKIANADWGGIVNYGVGAVTVGTEQEWYYNGNNSSVASDFEGTISFALGAPRANITVLFSTETSGIEDVVVEGTEEIEYFNLQGVRVANPENGIYIARQGKKVYKVVK